MFEDRVQGTRFWARVRAFDIECPSCGKLTRHQAPTKQWEPGCSRWRCSGCGCTLVIGVIAWLPQRGPAYTPPDQRTTIAQAQELRRDNCGWLHGDERRGGEDMVNVVMRRALPRF